MRGLKRDHTARVIGPSRSCRTCVAARTNIGHPDGAHAAQLEVLVDEGAEGCLELR